MGNNISQKNRTSTSEIKYNLKDVIGQNEAISELTKIMTFFKNKQISEHWRISPPKGILFVGPPGVGKTMSVRALGNELGNDVILTELNFSDIASKWVNATTENFTRVISIYKEKAAKNKLIIFIDEIDSFLPNRDNSNYLHQSEIKLVNQFLTWMDGGLVSLENIIVIGATNNIDRVDTAILRPVRFDKIIKFYEFDAKNIIKAFQMHISKFNFNQNQIEVIDWDEIESEIIDKNLPGASISGILMSTLESKAMEHSRNLEENESNQYMDSSVLPKPISTEDILFQIRKYLSSIQHLKLSTNKKEKTILYN